MTAFPDHPFWDFSLRTYGAEDVAPACLALQERYGIDVNFLLLCLWLGHAGHGAVGPAEIERLHGVAAGWHAEVVRHLRTVRKRLKEPIAGEDRALALSLRQSIQKIEIDAEHIEQLMLGAAVPDASPETAGGGYDLTAARANLNTYFALIGAALDEAGKTSLETILGAAFSSVGSSH